MLFSKPLPQGCVLPQNAQNQPGLPKVSNEFNQTPLQRRFWASLMWQHNADNPFSTQLWSKPWNIECNKDGLVGGYSDSASYSNYNLNQEHNTRTQEYHSNLNYDLIIKFGTSAVKCAVNNYSEFSVNWSWLDASDKCLAKCTQANGSGFLFFDNLTTSFTISGQNVIKLQNQANSGGFSAYGVQINGRNYAIFCSGNVAFNESSITVPQNTAWISLAVLPDNSQTIWNIYKDAAPNKIVGSNFVYEFDQNTSTLTSSFVYQTKSYVTGQPGNTVIFLQPHHWRNVKDVSSLQKNVSLFSAHGPMKMVYSVQFQTVLKFNGVLPSFPLVGLSQDQQTLTQIQNLLKSVDQIDLTDIAPDFYWQNKLFNIIAQNILIADQIGDAKTRDSLVAKLKSKMTAWLSDSNDLPTIYYYDVWKVLLTYPSSYGEAEMMNDFTLQRGYFLVASYVVGLYDSSFIKTYQPKIDKFIQGFFNWDANDSQFALYNSFDSYNSTSPASGISCFANGNNVESSSESMISAYGMILWANLTGNEKAKQLGIAIYSNCVTAIEEYHFDITKTNFPKNQNPQWCINWIEQGASLATFWSSTQFEMMGINYLPITAGSIYLARNSDHLKDVRKWLVNYPKYTADNLNSDNSQQPLAWDTTKNPTFPVWNDIHMEVRSFVDPNGALAEYKQTLPWTSVEGGESQCHTLSHIYALSNLGILDTTIFCNTPFYNVFKNGNGTKSYCVFNQSNKSVNAQFTDGIKFDVIANSTVVYKNARIISTWTLGKSANGSITPSPPVPDPKPAPIPDPTPISGKFIHTNDFDYQINTNNNVLTIDWQTTSSGQTNAKFVDVHIKSSIASAALNVNARMTNTNDQAWTYKMTLPNQIDLTSVTVQFTYFTNFGHDSSIFVVGTDDNNGQPTPIVPSPTPSNDTTKANGIKILSDKISFYFTSPTTSTYCIVHYTLGNQTQQNVQMKSNDNGKTFALDIPIASTPKISFNFTYQTPKGQQDTQIQYV